MSPAVVIVGHGLLLVGGVVWLLIDRCRRGRPAPDVCSAARTQEQVWMVAEYSWWLAGEVAVRGVVEEEVQR